MNKNNISDTSIKPLCLDIEPENDVNVNTGKEKDHTEEIDVDVKQEIKTNESNL